jgi:primosomal protein N'
MDARCPECEKVAVLNDEVTSVKCPHCNFEADYETYLEIMKEQAIKRVLIGCTVTDNGIEWHWQ